jgi:hypothetical protein
MSISDLISAKETLKRTHYRMGSEVISWADKKEIENDGKKRR